MSRTIGAAVQSALEAANVPLLVFVELDFSGGFVRVTNAPYAFDWNGYTWAGIGRLGGIDAVKEGSSLEARGIGLRLSGVPVSGEGASENISIALNQTYQGRDCRVWAAPLGASDAPRHSGTAAGGSPANDNVTSLQLAADAPGSFPSGSVLQLVSGPGSVQERPIVSYDGVTKVATVERWRTNLLARSEEFDNASWGKDGGISVSADQATAPDGTVSMDKMTKAAGALTNWSQLTQTVSASPFGKTYSFSVWVAALSGTKNFSITISDVNFLSRHSGQMTATTTPQRFKWEGQTGWDAAATLIGGGINITDATGDLLVWGAQLEEAETSGDYIKTEAAAITLPDSSTDYEVPDAAPNPYTILADPKLVFLGRMDYMDLDIGQTATITLFAESRLADLERPRVRRYNSADQRAVYPDDAGLDFAEAMVERNLIWGRRR